MRMETKRLILRPWIMEDAESCYEYAREPEVALSTGWKPHASAEESRFVIANFLQGPECYAICRKEDNRAIGSIELMLKGNAREIVAREDECELGFWLGKPFWGRGYMPEAAQALLERAFTQLHMERVWCGHMADNERSKRTQEKMGFVFHHEEKQKEMRSIGRVVDHVMNCMTKATWESGIVVRSLTEEEKKSACDLAWKVFLEYEAPVYAQEGIDEFRSTLDSPERIGAMRMYGAFVQGELAGMLALRPVQHISLFFVETKYQGQGLGRRLMERMMKDYEEQTFMVNSAPYALEIYKHMGFVPAGEETTDHGIRFTPMIYQR